MLKKQSNIRDVLDVLLDSRLYYELTIKERLMLVKHLVCRPQQAGQR